MKRDNLAGKHAEIGLYFEKILVLRYLTPDRWDRATDASSEERVRTLVCCRPPLVKKTRKSRAFDSLKRRWSLKSSAAFSLLCILKRRGNPAMRCALLYSFRRGYRRYISKKSHVSSCLVSNSLLWGWVAAPTALSRAVMVQAMGTMLSE